ncbi:MAG: hypothetical protein PHV20_04455 [Bacteroidales bacterium]|nr:hypothetical protein [Bacteroidales bacterium]
MKFFLLLFVLILSFFSTGLAQYVISTSGGDLSNSSASVSFSVGQVAIQNSDSLDGRLTEGIIQVYETIILTTVDEKKQNQYKIRVFHDKLTDQLIVEKFDIESKGEILQLFNSNGNILLERKLGDKLTIISMKNLSDRYFVINILNTELKKTIIYKIIK